MVVGHRILDHRILDHTKVAKPNVVKSLHIDLMLIKYIDDIKSRFWREDQLRKGTREPMQDESRAQLSLKTPHP